MEAVSLPDENLWEIIHKLDAALNLHQRDEAQAIFAQMQAASPRHRVTLDARYRLAIYDENPNQRLAAVDDLLATYPDNPCLQQLKLSSLRDLSHREERLQTYEKLCRGKEANYVFFQQYAQELTSDARRYKEAIELLTRSLRRNSTDGGTYYILANIYWNQRRFEEALELYRIAACLNDKDEHIVHSYFIASKWFKKTEETLRFMSRRFQRFGRKSNYPAQTLFGAYLELDRAQEAASLLEEAMQLRPDDAQMQLFAANAYLRISLQYVEQAAALLEKARHRAPRGEWLQTAASLAEGKGEFAQALDLWLELAELQPLNIEAHRSVSRILADNQGRKASLDYLQKMSERFPHYYPLHALQLEWIRNEPYDVREAAVRRAIERFPNDAWMRREMGFLLSAMRDHSAPGAKPKSPSAWNRTIPAFTPCGAKFSKPREKLPKPNKPCTKPSKYPSTTTSLFPRGYNCAIPSKSGARC